MAIEIKVIIPRASAIGRLSVFQSLAQKAKIAIKIIAKLIQTRMNCLPDLSVTR